jgi:signal transduction histidine kinase
MVSVQDEEQRRISGILHDQVLQLLAAAKMKHGLLRIGKGTGDVQNLHGEIEKLLGQAIEMLRSLSFELKTSSLIKLGLSEAIGQLCKALEARYGISFDYHTERKELPLGTEAVVLLFKGVRELLFNVVKHAKVKQATVTMERKDAHLILTVADRGVGFEVPNTSDNLQIGEGLGLYSVQEWMRDIRGELEIDSVPGSHTSITLRVPIAHDEHTAGG